jgi:predicted kinase
VRTLVVVSGAPGTGKSTVAETLSNHLGWPLLSVDVVKETFGDVLGNGDFDWSRAVGEAAAALVFRLAAEHRSAVVEGWWRRERRERAIHEFAGCIEVFCHCDPSEAERRVRRRLAEGRHPIHGDVVDPTMLDGHAALVAGVQSLGLGGPVVDVDTTYGFHSDDVCTRVDQLLATT